MQYETPKLEILLVEEELFMALSVNESGDGDTDGEIDWDNWN